MKSDWETVSLNFVPYKDTGIGIMCAIDDVEVLLDDHIVKTTTMKNSPFIKPFEKDVNEWDFRLVGYFCLHHVITLMNIYVYSSQNLKSNCLHFMTFDFTN